MARLKRYVAPKFWNLQTKKSKWTVAVRPGPHKKMESIPLQILLRDVLQIAETGKEAKNILQSNEVHVDGRIVRDFAFPVGLMDVISFPRIKKYFRIVPTKKGIGPVEISESESKLKILKIKNKKTLKKGKVQLNMHDGRNVLVPKDEYATGDSILVELPKIKIVDHVKLTKGNTILIFEGKDAGTIGKVIEVISSGKGKIRVLYETDNGKDETIKDHVIVVGKTKPLVTVGV